MYSVGTGKILQDGINVFYNCDINYFKISLQISPLVGQSRRGLVAHLTALSKSLSAQLQWIHYENDIWDLGQLFIGETQIGDNRFEKIYLLLKIQNNLNQFLIAELIEFRFPILLNKENQT